MKLIDILIGFLNLEIEHDFIFPILILYLYTIVWNF